MTAAAGPAAARHLPTNRCPTKVFTQMRPNRAFPPITALMIILLLQTTAARAEFISNEQLLDWLNEAARQGGSFKDTTLALGFVSAVHDLDARREICTPAGLRARELLRTVRLWMRGNSQSTWGANGAATARRALVETYPCPRSPADDTHR